MRLKCLAPSGGAGAGEFRGYTEDVGNEDER